jgi:hypothetical protein
VGPNRASQRVGGKVVTKSVYLGPVNPKRKRRGGGLLAALTVPTVIMGTLQAVGLAMKSRIGPPGGRPFPPVKESFRVVHDPRRVLSEDEWSARRRNMSDDEWERYISHAKHSIVEHPDVGRKEAMKAARTEHAETLDARDKAAKSDAKGTDLSEATAGDEGEPE